MSCGPQTPREIARPGGANPIRVPGDGTRPPRLCAVHFHLPAEHAGIAACGFAGEHAASGAAGEGVCARPPGGPGRPVRPGDEIELHVVYTSWPLTTVRRPRRRERDRRRR